MTVSLSPLHVFLKNLSITVITLILWLSLIPNLSAQLPPSIHRISREDSAVDLLQSSEKTFQSSVSPDLGYSLTCKTKSLLLQGGIEFDLRPLSAELWVKLDSIDSFNIFLAHEKKSSPQHWEFYTFAKSGKPALYLPGNPAGETILAKTALKTGQWYHLGFVLTEDHAEIFVDGISVGSGKINRKSPPTKKETQFAIGSLVPRGLNCQGQIDEVRIIQGVRSFSKESIPRKPFTADNNTLLLCHFEKKTPPLSQNLSSVEIEKTKTKKSTIPAQKTNDNPSTARFSDLPEKWRASVAGKTKPDDFLHYSELNPDETTAVPLEGKLAERNGGQLVLKSRFDSLFPLGAMEIKVRPGEHPIRNIPIQKCPKDLFTKRLSQLDIQSISYHEFRPGVFEHWGEEFVTLARQISGEIQLPRGAADQVYDRQALVFPEQEKHPVQVVIRRTEALIQSLEQNSGSLTPNQTQWRTALALLKKNLDPANAPQCDLDYFIAAALRRKLMFSDPELDGLNRILFLARACYAGSRLTNLFNSDRIGGHFATQIYGFNTIHGGGLFALSDWKKNNPVITDLLKGKKIQPTRECSRLAGKELNYGSFMSPELSYDGKTIFFSHCGAQEHRWLWTPETTWNIFKTPVDGGSIEQLTDSAYNDFDVCELPSGRLAFCSERRGGFIRCFLEPAELRVTTSVLHSMKQDGSDIYPLSFFETSEWQPSVDHNGMLIYTRWDYTDRENCLGSTFWTCAPDGRNPRSPHGNYPFPWHTFEDNKHGDHRYGNCPDAPSALPMTEMQFRAIPDSHKYLFTAAPHHGETFGSLCVLDLRIKNDFHMSQIRRLTPYTPFPESESRGRSQYQYGAAWPINTDLFLCNSWENLILLDRFGNDELLCERELLPIGYDPRLRLCEPIPIAARPRPPVVPQQTAQGIDNREKDQKSTVGIINVHIADLPFPKDRKPVKVRVIQVIPKPNPWMDKPFIGYATENTPRIPLGTAPIEKDGSAFFEVPSGKQILFQLVDQNDMAIQTMRAVAFTHPGEKLVCTGCHEPVDETVRNSSAFPLAFQRPASKLAPECGPVEPMNFYRFIKPVFDKKCVECHQKNKKGPLIMDYESMRPWVYYFSGGMAGTTVRNGSHGGSRSLPGRVGAGASPLSKILFDKNHKNSVLKEDRHKIFLWLDANAPRLGAFQDEKSQKEGNLVWPLLDTESCELYHTGFCQ